MFSETHRKQIICRGESAILARGLGSEPQMPANTEDSADWRGFPQPCSSAAEGVKTGGYDFCPRKPLKGKNLELLLSELP